MELLPSYPSALLTSTDSKIPTNPTTLLPRTLYPLSSAPTTIHPYSTSLRYNTEQRTRAALALQIHNLNHNSNLVNGMACECGVIPSHLTRADFIAMTNIYGECSSHVAGKNSTVSHGQPSTSPPPNLPCPVASSTLTSSLSKTAPLYHSQKTITAGMSCPSSFFSEKKSPVWLKVGRQLASITTLSAEFCHKSTPTLQKHSRTLTGYQVYRHSTREA